MPSFQFHPNFAGYAVQFNPFNPNVLAACAAENFGISGSGKVYVMDLANNNIVLKLCVATEVPF